MNKREFILKACLSLAGNEKFATVKSPDYVELNDGMIFENAYSLALTLEHTDSSIFDKEDKPTSADCLWDIADNIDDIKKILRELSNKQYPWNYDAE